MKPLRPYILLLRGPIVFFNLLAAVLSAAPSAPLQDNEKFISIVGRFAIDLPQKEAVQKPFTKSQVGGLEFFGSSFEWTLDNEIVLVDFYDGPANLEETGKTDFFLKAIREQYSNRTGQSSVLKETRITLQDHPGVLFVVQSDSERSMGWIYLNKNRFYRISMTLTSNDRLAERVQLLSTTFRFLQPTDSEARFRSLVEKMMPPSLPQEPGDKKLTSDLQDWGLKGRIKQIITEREKYFGNNLFGVKSLESIEDYDEKGNLTMRVSCLDGLPNSVTVYGYAEGSRAYRKRGTPPPLSLSSSGQSDQLFKINYKFDKQGRIAEMQTTSDNQELEKLIFRHDKRTIEKTGLIRPEVFPNLPAARIVLLLDQNGNVLEEQQYISEKKVTSLERAGAGLVEVEKKDVEMERTVYKLEVDSKGNWTKRTATLITTQKGKPVELPQHVQYRRIAYYE